jgi:hypothetical protein
VRELILIENQGRELSKSIAQYLDGKWMTWVDQPLGSVWQNCPRADVLAIAKSYSPVVIRIYEVKISRGDFQRDIFEGKYKSYLPFCNYLYFAIPSGLLKKEEIPEGCGLVTYSDKGWRAVKSPVKREISISQDFMLCLLMKGYQDDYARYRDLEKKRLGKNWEYKGLADAAQEFGLKLSYDIAHSQHYAERAKVLREEIEKIAMREFNDLSLAFSWIEHEVNSLLNKYKYGKEAGELLQLVMQLYNGETWNITKKLKEIAERLKSKED